MIIDFRTDPDHAQLYDIIDTATGRSMTDQPIFYADDETGIYRVYLRDAKGGFYVHPSHPDEAAWLERRGRFRLVLKARPDEAPAVPVQAESWRDRLPLL
jgi:hypothetical protein